MNLAKISKGSGVILNDIKVVIRTGIKVRYRRPGKQVKRVEEIFLLHGETNILVSEIPVGFLERGHLYAEPEKVFTVKGETERINKAMLFYSNKWCHFNYEHLLLDLFPKVFVHIEEIRAGGIKLLIPSSKFDKVILEYLELVGVEKENIAIINDDYVARVDKLYEFVSNGTCPFDLRPVEFYSFLRKYFSESIGKNSFLSFIDDINDNGRGKRIYLGRKGGQLSGKGRIISNMNEVNELLEKMGFLFLDVASMTFVQKAYAISNSEIVISEIGANCNNVLFSSDVENFIMLGHNKWKKMFYKDMFDELNEDSYSEIIFCEPLNKEHAVWKDPGGVNIPFKVDVTLLEQRISEIVET